VNTTARTDITPAGWPLGVSDAGHRNLIWVAAHAWPCTALRPGRLATEAITAMTRGQRPSDADTMTAGHETVVGHTTTLPWPP
jgi:hypothetical protein